MQRQFLMFVISQAFYSFLINKYSEKSIGKSSKKKKPRTKSLSNGSGRVRPMLDEDEDLPTQVLMRGE
ncbi:hypothetical protein K8R61_02930 [bacterium]|nr:hypothetical protein [bacterium]